MLFRTLINAVIVPQFLFTLVLFFYHLGANSEADALIFNVLFTFLTLIMLLLILAPGPVLNALRNCGGYPLTMAQGITRSLVTLIGPAIVVGYEAFIVLKIPDHTKIFCMQAFNVGSCISPTFIIASHIIAIVAILIAWVFTLRGEWRFE